MLIKSLNVSLKIEALNYSLQPCGIQLRSHYLEFTICQEKKTNSFSTSGAVATLMISLRH